jgi:hypothetical protein
MSLKSSAFCDVTPYNLVEIYSRFKRTYCTASKELWVPRQLFWTPTSLHDVAFQKVSILHVHRRKNHRSNILWLFDKHVGLYEHRPFPLVPVIIVLFCYLNSCLLSAVWIIYIQDFVTSLLRQIILAKSRVRKQEHEDFNQPITEKFGPEICSVFSYIIAFKLLFLACH